MKPTAAQMQNARRLFGRVAADTSRAREAIRTAHGNTQENWVRFVARCLQHGNAETAELRLIRQLHKVTMWLEKQSAERVREALLRRI